MFNIRGLFAGERQLAALDIGSSTIKLAEIQDTAKGYILSRFAQMPLPRGAIIDGTVVEPKVLTATIKELYKQSGCKQKRIVTSLSGHAVIVKKVAFDRMDETELQDLIRDEAAKYLPFDDLTAVNYDCQILGDNPYNPNQMDVLIVVAKKEIIDRYTEAIEESGLTPVIMDVDSFALETMYEENYAFDQNDVAVLVNIGASITNINAVKGGASIFTRDFTIGGNFVTEMIAKKLNISFEDAEEVKISGLGDDERTQGISRDGLIAYADMICSEIERSVDYFRSTFGGEIIGQVLLSGCGALIPGMAADLSRRLGLTVEMIDPFRRITCNKSILDKETADRLGPIAAVGVGLALRKIGDKA
ncbi:MAG: type IV pilus assembly protein PilM [Deltaproteobacteria bacterium]|nr:MAG: type IV pilus assembly protein PilM [Deltaproteobacteria bacterium]